MTGGYRQWVIGLVVAAAACGPARLALRAPAQASSSGSARLPAGGPTFVAQPPLRPFGPSRPHTTVAELPLDSMAVVRVPTMLTSAEAPSRLPAPGESTGDLRVWHVTRAGTWGWEYRVRGMTRVAQLRFVGPLADSVGARPPVCARGKAELVPARWEGIVRSVRGADGTASYVEYAIVDGWFDLSSCRASGVRRTVAVLDEIVPELVYGARVCGPACDDGHADALIVATPSGTHVQLPYARGGTVPFDAALRATWLPLRAGEGGGAAVKVDACALRRWHDEVVRRPRSDDAAADWLDATGFWLGLETSHATAESAPVAVSYVWRLDANGNASPLPPAEVHALASKCAPQAD